MVEYGLLKALVILVFFAISVFAVFSVKNRKGSIREVKKEKYEIEDLIEEVKEIVNTITRSNLHELGLSEESFIRRQNMRTSLKSALKNCTYGSINDKEYVKDFIKDILRRQFITKDNINRFVSFNNDLLLSATDKFDILLHDYKKEYGYKGLKELIKKHNLDALQRGIEDEETQHYIIKEEDIERVYENENVMLDFEDKLSIITQRVYQAYKGFGVVDEIRDMDIDGVSGGVSGITRYSGLDFFETNVEDIIKMPAHYDSVWIFFEGKSISLNFMSFGSENELKRICQNIYRYKKAGQISEKDGYRVNEMKDGSRVVVVRPSFAESWAFFMRKFHIKNVTLEKLIKGEDSFLAVETIKYLAKGSRITSITGSQGSGKTTLLLAMIKHIYATYTLRVQEMAFELHLRNVYPFRNILTFRETEHVSGQEGLDVQKKTDGTVNIIGEIATDEISVWMLQAAMVASKFTIFTHHAKTVSDLVLSLRNALLKQNVFRDEKVAVEQVVNVIDFDIHLEKDNKGNRYISRITEIVKEEGWSYKANYKEANTHQKKVENFMEIVGAYFLDKMNNVYFKERNIIEYKDGRYEVGESFTQKTIEAMKNNMNSSDREHFDMFIRKYFRRENVLPN